MIYLLIALGVIVLVMILCLILGTNTAHHLPGFPYPVSKEFKEKYEEEQKIRQEIVEATIKGLEEENERLKKKLEEPEKEWEELKEALEANRVAAGDKRKLFADEE